MTSLLFGMVKDVRNYKVKAGMALDDRACIKDDKKTAWGFIFLMETRIDGQKNDRLAESNQSSTRT
jgi:hypothetical protein